MKRSKNRRINEIKSKKERRRASWKPKPLKNWQHLLLQPGCPIGKRFLERYNYFFDWLEKPEGEDWRSQRKYPIEPFVAWNKFTNPDTTIALRFGKLTKFITIDIDAGSPYHPFVDEKKFKEIISLMAAKGLEGYVITQSSFSGGIHVIFPLPEWLPTFKIARQLKIYMLRKGVEVKDGVLEIFPNPKRWADGKENFSKYKGLALPLQPGRGSFLLDDDYFPVSQDIEQFLDWMDIEEQKQDLKKFKRFLRYKFKRISQSMYKKLKDKEGNERSEKAINWEKFLEDLIENGFTGSGQTNSILIKVCTYGIVFKGLSGEALQKFVATTVGGMKGFTYHSRHQHDLEKRAAEVCKTTEINEHYKNYPNVPERRLKNYEELYKASQEKIKKTNKKTEDYLIRLKEVIEYIESQQQKPKNLTELRNLIHQTGKELHGKAFNNATLNKKEAKRIWHPKFRTERVSTEKLVKEESAGSFTSPEIESFLPEKDQQKTKTEGFSTLTNQEFASIFGVYEVSNLHLAQADQHSVASGGHGVQKIEDNESYAPLKEEKWQFEVDGYTFTLSSGEIIGMSEREIQQRKLSKLTFHLPRCAPEQRPALWKIIAAEKEKLAAMTPPPPPEPSSSSVPSSPSKPSPEPTPKAGCAPALEDPDIARARELARKGMKVISPKIRKYCQELNINISEGLNSLFIALPEQQVLNAFEVVRSQGDGIRNREAYLATAIKNGWKLNHGGGSSPPENPPRIYPPGFLEAYRRGIEAGYFIDIPAESLSFDRKTDYPEYYVYLINSRDKKGFTVMPWSQALDFTGPI